ncbi:hypothetical protein F511_22443 [Dorcoceras hygrometricum]|uniref:Uncharacterized protein n=1 Tax=Dorcoceras hygrometricum TaxID=472368 RepID=A0A2Z7B5S6_9LAMI|nr:hypothetical protein F511_22443 [Dorcoceras hygrometricum]
MCVSAVAVGISWSNSASLDFRLWISAVAYERVSYRMVSQAIPLAVVLIQLVVPQEVDRVSQLCIVSICTDITAGGMSRMPPRRRGRGRGQFQESKGQNEYQHSIPLRGRGRREEDEVDDLAAHVESMELVMVRFQRMSPQVFNGDESSADADSWLQHITVIVPKIGSMGSKQLQEFRRGGGG